MIKVIIGNPPYSAGQSCYHDLAENQRYDGIHQRISETYGDLKAQNKTQFFNSYIKAIRTASDSSCDRVIIGFIVSNGWVAGKNLWRFRQCLQDEFDSIHLLNARGNKRIETYLDYVSTEGQSLFFPKYQIGTCIMFLVKNGGRKKPIKYYELANMTRDEKVEFLSKGEVPWQDLKPNIYHDWIKQRSEEFYDHMPVIDKDKNKQNKSVFHRYIYPEDGSNSKWIYNPSRENLTQNMRLLLKTYNNDVERYKQHDKTLTTGAEVLRFVNLDLTKIKWNDKLIASLKKKRRIEFDPDKIKLVEYRPMVKRWCYTDVRIWPCNKSLTIRDDQISILTTGAHSQFCHKSFIIKGMCDRAILDALSVLPLYIYDDCGNKKSNITDEALDHFQYGKELVTKEDIFYYVYGVINSKSYLKKYRFNVNIDWDRIPRAKTYEEFDRLCQVGRNLADLHINYEDIDLALLPDSIYFELDGERVGVDAIPADCYKLDLNRMSFPNISKKLLHEIKFNSRIRIKGIPNEAHTYRTGFLNKSLVGNVMSCLRVRVYRKQQILHDPNQISDEPDYPFKLILKAIIAGCETHKILADT